MHYLLPWAFSEMFSYKILILSLWTHLLALGSPIPGRYGCCWQTSLLWHWPPHVIHPPKIRADPLLSSANSKQTEPCSIAQKQLWVTKSCHLFLEVSLPSHCPDLYLNLVCTAATGPHPVLWGVLHGFHSFMSFLMSQRLSGPKKKSRICLIMGLRQQS